MHKVCAVNRQHVILVKKNDILTMPPSVLLRKFFKKKFCPLQHNNLCPVEAKKTKTEGYLESTLIS